MRGYVQRGLENQLHKYLDVFPVVAILGPRQCGKSTTAKEVISNIKNSVYLDLERKADRNKVTDIDLYMASHKNDLVCLDEIQRLPEIFQDLRPIVDEHGKNGHLLILGSASKDLLRQSSESLAGRIGFLELTPFLSEEVDDSRKLWTRGGFPRSYLARDEEQSNLWRENFITTYLERDLPGLGLRIPPGVLDRLWTMCAHISAELLNSSKLGSAIGVSHTTVRRYMEILAETFMVRLLRPYHANVKKRLVKSPKLFVRDTGVLHALLNIKSHDDLLGSPKAGQSWETFVVEQIINQFPSLHFYFYRTADGAEIDLVIETANNLYAIECKLSTAPKPSRGFWHCLEDLAVKKSWIIAPIEDSYQIEKGVTVTSLRRFIAEFSNTDKSSE